MKSYIATIDEHKYAACISPVESGVILHLQYTNMAGKTKTIANQEFKTEYNTMLSLKRRYPDITWSPIK